MAAVATNKLWAYIESLSLSKRDRSWLADRFQPHNSINNDLTG